MIAPPPSYFPRLREICDRHDVLLIADEVITGFGRTGAWFAVEHENVVPDLLVLAKGLINWGPTRLVFGAKAEILEYDHQVIRTVTQAYHAPSVIRLQHHIRRPRPRVKLTRREVFARDRHTCQYCGRQAADLTARLVQQSI